MWPGVCSATHSRPAEPHDVGLSRPDRRLGSAHPLRRFGICAFRSRAPRPPHGVPSAQQRVAEGSPRSGSRRQPVGDRARSSMSSRSASSRVEPVAERRWVTMSAPVSSMQEPGAAEVVGVGVGDDHRVHRAQRHAGAAAVVAELLPRLRTGETGVDDSHAALVLEDVAVHVAEAGHARSAAESAGRRSDLGDAVGRRELLLLRWSGRGSHRVRRARRLCGRIGTRGE